MRGRVLIVAGSDSGGGAGIQADIKTVTALGGFAMTALTALTAQNTRGVYGIHAVPDAFITHQIDVVLDDIGADAIKTGMLHSPSVIETVVAALAQSQAPLVVDPVMRAKGGAALLQPEAQAALTELLLPRAAVLTPNVPEAEALTGLSIETTADLRRVGEALLALGPKAVLMKGGHSAGNICSDALVTAERVTWLSAPRIDTRKFHPVDAARWHASELCDAASASTLAASALALALVSALALL